MATSQFAGEASYDYLSPGAEPSSSADALQAENQLTATIYGKWKYYVSVLGEPKTIAQLTKIRGNIAADLINEGVTATPQQIAAAAGDLITGSLTIPQEVKNAASAIASLVPWYLNPVNILLMGAGGVVVYFTWPLLLQMAVGTTKRGFKAFKGKKK